MSKGSGLGMDCAGEAASSGLAPTSGSLGVAGVVEWGGVGHFDDNGMKGGSESRGVSGTGPAATGGATGGVGKITKGRDKLAKLRKRLKCCSVDQLVDQMLELVRTDTVSENAMFATMASVDVGHLLQKCESAHHVMLSELSRDVGGISSSDVRGGNVEKEDIKGSDVGNCQERNEITGDRVENEKVRELDAGVAKQYRRNFSQYRTCVVSNGKLLQDAGLWKELVSFCVGAAAINQRTPVRAEESLNKLGRQIWTRLEQYARKGTMEFAKSVKSDGDVASGKTANALSLVDKLSEECVRSFPTVAQMLRDLRTRLGAMHDESGTGSQNITTKNLMNGTIADVVSSVDESALPSGTIHQNSVLLKARVLGSMAQVATVRGPDGGVDVNVSSHLE